MKKTESDYSIEKRIILGKRIQYLRKQQNLRQEELAEILNISRTHLGNLETGKVSPSFTLFNELVDYFNCSSDFLIGKVTTPQQYSESDSTFNVLDFIREFGDYIRFDDIEVTEEEKDKIINAIKYALSIVKL